MKCKEKYPYEDFVKHQLAVKTTRPLLFDCLFVLSQAVRCWCYLVLIYLRLTTTRLNNWPLSDQ